ncbi:ATP-dependent Clp protease ATP-binding subunit [Patescibacteria group bacterium]|nr:ATP-dependent Clp protease ATP-binding subunit [Patescibacteria group bacterium]
MAQQFNLKETKIFRAVKQEKFPLFRFAKFFKNFFSILFVLSLAFVGFSLFGPLSLTISLKISVLFLFLFLIFWESGLFFNIKLKTPELKINLADAIKNPEDYNLAEFLTLGSAKIIEGAIHFCRKRKISEVSATALLYAALEKSKVVGYIFMRMGLDPINVLHNLKNSLEKSKRDKNPIGLYSEDFNKVILQAAETANERKHTRIEEMDILIGISHAGFFEQILIDANLKTEDFENLTLWFDYLDRKIEENRKFWKKENLSVYGSMGKDWASGYTIILDQYSIDWTKNIRKWLFKAIIGHEKEIEQVQMALAKSGLKNVLIIGDPGAGRESIIEGLAKKTCLGKSLPELNYYRVVELDMTALLSRINNPEEVENTLDRIFQEVVTAGNIVLVIKEFHNYIGIEVNQPGMVDISGVIGKYLKAPEFRFVATTDYSGLHTRLENNPSLLEMFGKIEISEVSEQETIRILQNLALELERKYKIFITYPAIRELVSLSARYIPNQPFPKKAIDLLQDVAVYVARSAKEKVVLPEHVAKVISTKTEIPVGKIEVEEKKTLLNLEKLIHVRIINQEEAVKEISIAMRRARAGIGSKKRPIGSFLFLGPTGVGKTETSKALAQIYFGGEERMIRLDMSEFQAIADIPRLLGVRGEEGLLTTPVREKPFSLLLIDEIEKAHPNILNLFLQVLDEGNITDGQGRKTVFTSTIIICTSNAGSEVIFEATGKNEPIDKEKLLSSLFNKGIFRPEFINRFDAVVIFKPLTKDNLLDISQLMLASLKKSLKEKNVDFIITESLKEKVVELSYKPAFGAREMRRVIQNNIESTVAQALLSDNLKRGDRFEISPEKFELVKIDPPASAMPACNAVETAGRPEALRAGEEKTKKKIN